MELISNIKKRFNDWAYNLWFKIGNKHKWHGRNKKSKYKWYTEYKQMKREKIQKRQNKARKIKSKTINKKPLNDRGRKR